MRITELIDPDSPKDRDFLIEDESRRMLISISADIDQSYTDQPAWHETKPTNHDLATFLAPLVCALISQPFRDTLEP